MLMALSLMQASQLSDLQCYTCVTEWTLTSSKCQWPCDPRKNNLRWPGYAQFTVRVPPLYSQCSSREADLLRVDFKLVIIYYTRKIHRCVLLTCCNMCVCVIESVKYPVILLEHCTNSGLNLSVILSVVSFGSPRDFTSTSFRHSAVSVGVLRRQPSVWVNWNIFFINKRVDLASSQK